MPSAPHAAPAPAPGSGLQSPAGPRSHFGVGEYESDGAVTSEAVEVELPVAGVMLRIASQLIDLVVLAAAGLALGILVSQVIPSVSLAVARTLLIVVIVLLVLGIPITLETLTRGKTVGKLALGLRTVRDDGGPITFRHAVVRGLVGWVEIYLAQGTVALVAALLMSRNRRLGDLAAGTFVINERQTMRLPVPAQMPNELAAWARTADIASLPPSLALATRQFLHRAPTLTPQSRYVLGLDLARKVSLHVSPQPPAGHHPETFLAAVLADRRHRDAQRLLREADLRGRVIGPDPLPPGTGSSAGQTR